MSLWLAAAYPWIKAAHIISVVAWMAGLLYLPRLFVYHAEALTGSDLALTFEIMERRLLRGIMLPASIATIVFGTLLAATPGVVDWRQGWIWLKLAVVGGLLASFTTCWRTGGKSLPQDQLRTRRASFASSMNYRPSR